MLPVVALLAGLEDLREGMGALRYLLVLVGKGELAGTACLELGAMGMLRMALVGFAQLQVEVGTDLVAEEEGGMQAVAVEHKHSIVFQWQ